MLFLQKETETEDIEIALHANTYHLKQNPNKHSFITHTPTFRYKITNTIILYNNFKVFFRLHFSWFFPSRSTMLVEIKSNYGRKQS